MGLSQKNTMVSTAGFFGYLVGYALLCIPLLIWALADRAGRAVIAKLGIRMSPALKT